MPSVHISLSACSTVSSVGRTRRRTANRPTANQQLTTWHACVYCLYKRPFSPVKAIIRLVSAGTDNNWTMDKSGSSQNNPKKSGALAQSNSSKIRLAPPKTIDWAIGTLEGCKRKRCCGVALDADVYFHTAHEYFKSFTKCREAKGHCDAKLKQHEQRRIELLEKLRLLQAAFSRDAQEKEAFREKNVLLLSENVNLRSQLHEQQTLGVRLQEKVQALADDMQGLQEKVDELDMRCTGFKEEVEGKEVEINKLRTSMAAVEQKNQQRDALDVSKSEAKPEAVVAQDVKGHALLASKRRSEERDNDGEITFIGTSKRSKSSETTPGTAVAAAQPLNSSNSTAIDQPQMPL
uniref:Uncharacterized protein n=1 Tax=Globodera rostochiensis TaxID=31243 RepID=A0A914I5D2_GLORO